MVVNGTAPAPSVERIDGERIDLAAALRALEVAFSLSGYAVLSVFGWGCDFDRGRRPAAAPLAARSDACRVKAELCVSGTVRVEEVGDLCPLKAKFTAELPQFEVCRVSLGCSGWGWCCCFCFL